MRGGYGRSTSEVQPKNERTPVVSGAVEEMILENAPNSIVN
jgi:hypothetical protein